MALNRSSREMIFDFYVFTVTLVPSSRRASTVTYPSPSVAPVTRQILPITFSPPQDSICWLAQA